MKHTVTFLYKQNLRTGSTKDLGGQLVEKLLPLVFGLEELRKVYAGIC